MPNNLKIDCALEVNKKDYDRMTKGQVPYDYGNAGKIIKKHIDGVLK